MTLAQGKVADLAETNGHLAVVSEDGLTVKVLPASGVKCARCWKFTTDVGENAAYADLCLPCSHALCDLSQVHDFSHR